MSKVPNATDMNTEEELLPLPDEVVQPAPVEEPAEEVAPEPEKLMRVKLRNGKEYTGKTEREIMQALIEDHERMQADFQTRTHQATEAKGKIRYQEERARPEGYDDQKYLDLLGKDTLAARRYQDQYYYGLADDEDPAAAFRFSYQLADRVADTLEVAEFHRMNPDVPGRLSKEDAETVFREIDQRGLQVTAFNINGIFHELKNRGIVRLNSPAPDGTKPVQYEDIDLTPQEKPRSRGASAPKVTGGGDRTTSGTGGKSIQELERMTKDELEAHLRRTGFLQH